MLTRVPAVFEDELTDIMFSDRSYVAAEMTAFLLFWLSRLRCPVLNEPTATCLAGRYWRREQWIDQAARAGIAVHAFPAGCARTLLKNGSHQTIRGCHCDCGWQ